MWSGTKERASWPEIWICCPSGGSPGQTLHNWWTGFRFYGAKPLEQTTQLRNTKSVQTYKSLLKALAIYLQQPSEITALENTQYWVIWALKYNYFDWLIEVLIQVLYHQTTGLMTSYAIRSSYVVVRQMRHLLIKFYHLPKVLLIRHSNANMYENIDCRHY
jgi:hypothetical protein